MMQSNYNGSQYYEYDYDDGYVDEDDEEMPETERELAEDAQWKLIQKNTFTRWANEHLKHANSGVEDIQTELEDGLRLAALVEVLSGCKLKSLNRRPTFRTQKLENVTLTLKFLEEEEGIRLVNIDSTDIVDSKLKLILGLIWTLILHYSITMPSWEGEEERPKGDQGKGPTPKQRLASWINAKMPNRPINNFTTDWNDGTALGALVDACAPGLCPDWNEWNPRNRLGNAREAMDSAEQWLDVPQLIKPEEIINPKVDEKAVMTYLSQFPNAKLKSGAPLRPKNDPSRVKAYGPGLEPRGNSVGMPAKFTVETFSAGKGKLDIIVINPKGQHEPCDILFNNDRNQTYSCAYEPTVEGEYRVIIKYSNKEIPRSPFHVMVEGAAGDPNKVTASGPGIEPVGNIVSKRTFFNIFTEGAGSGNVDCVILDPHGNRETVKPQITPQDNGKYLVEYIPKVEGLHSVNVFFAGQQIAKSPFGVSVGGLCNPKKAYATGRGIQPTGIRVGDNADFKVHTEDAGDGGEVQAKVTGPGGVPEKCFVRQTGPNLFDCSYKPSKVGPHVVSVSYGVDQIHRSPFNVNVAPRKKSNIKAYGPGLEGGMVGFPAVFTVETNGETGSLGFSIDGPSEAKIDCKDNGDGSAEVAYWPTAPGEYAVHILCDDEDIPKSPYMVDIQSASRDFNPNNVKVYGKGVEPEGIIVNQPADFTVDARNAGNAPVSAKCYNSSGDPVPLNVKDKFDGTLGCRYNPVKPEKHTVVVSQGGVNVPKSPFKVNVSEPTRPDRVKVYGPGIERAKRNTPTYFIVDCKEAGPGDVGIGLTDENNRDVPAESEYNKDGTFTIKYCPKSVGQYTASVFYGDTEVPRSPFKVPVSSDVDNSKVRIENLDKQPTINTPQTFDIIPSKTFGKVNNHLPCKVTVAGPNGKKSPAKVTPSPKGYLVEYTPDKLGPHTIDVNIDDGPVPGCPLTVNASLPVAEPVAVAEEPLLKSQKKAEEHAAVRPWQPEQIVPRESIPRQSAPVKRPIRAYGDGLYKGIANKPASFTIDSRDAPPGPLNVTVEGPSEATIDCQDNGDGTCNVTYTVTEPGVYTINILSRDAHIENSPFHANIAPDPLNNIRLVRAYGPGLKPNGVVQNSPAKFTVDASAVDKFGERPVQANLVNPRGQLIPVQTENLRDGTYSCSYSPLDEGPHEVEVFYDGMEVPGSPFKVMIAPSSDPTRVRAYGPGLEGGYTGELQKFRVELNGAGQGGLGFSIEGPSETKINCFDNRDGTFAVDYLPVKAGSYDITVKFNDADIPGSPFLVPIRDRLDAAKVRAYGRGLEPRGARVSKPATFHIDTSRAGKGPIEATVIDRRGRTRMCQVTPNMKTPDLYDATYVPEEEGPITIDVRFGNQSIPRSPFPQNVLPRSEPHRVRVYGEGIRPDGNLACKQTEFTIDYRDAGEGPVKVTVQHPDGHEVPCSLIPQSEGVMNCCYTPDDVGRFIVNVSFDGKELPESPYYVRTSPVGRADQCWIEDGNNEYIPVRQESVVTVNNSQAGPGNITCNVTRPDGTPVNAGVEKNNDGTTSVFYLPMDKGDYLVDIKHGGQRIPNGRFVQKAVDPSELPNGLIEENIMPDKVDGVRSAPADSYHPVDFKFPVGPNFDLIDAVILTPSERTVRPDVIDNHDDTVTIRYLPTERGMHELSVSYNKQPIPGSPYKFFVESIGTGRVTAYGPGLSHGTTGQPAEFTIVTREAGAGGLALAVEGPSKAEIQCHDNRDGTCGVTYLPLCPGDYNILIKFMDKHITGSPFTARISGEPRKRAQVSVGTTSDVPLKISETDISSLMASIRSPSGREEPCILKRLPSGHLGISFTPREVGEHLVNVYRNGRHIPNSPFKIFVGDADVGNARRVRVFGDGLERGMANEMNQFTVDTRNAGYGSLSLSIEGPSKADIECHDNHDGTCLVTYKPTEPGNYIINIKYADEHVQGSPFMVHIGGEPSSRMLERIIRRREAADVTHIGSQCELSLRVPGTNPYDMTATVTSPSGITERCEIVDLQDCHYSIKFIPKEMGVHTVSVKHKDSHIPGSPFQFTVGPITEGGAHKVQAAGPGLEVGYINTQNEFNIYTREAGAGGLSIAIEGPSKAEIDFEDRKDGSCGVSYRVSEPGEYIASIKFNDDHIPNSPYRIFVGSGDGTGKHLSVAALQNRGLEVGRPAAFTVTYNGVGAGGHLRSWVQTPSGAEDEAIVQSVDRDQYTVRFIPKENGPHLIHVNTDDAPLPGSPFRVMVGAFDADPCMVHASGDGLTRGRVGVRNNFFVNTVNAGSGALSVTVDGPSKVQLNCHEHDDGYQFTYTPSSAGEYLITIKYGGNYHITGSPFKALVYGHGNESLAPMSEQSHVVVKTVEKNVSVPRQGGKFPGLADHVQVHGPGLSNAYIDRVNQFTIDASQAGNEVLFVGVNGPSKPCDEVIIKHIGLNQFAVSYTVKESGTHMIMIKWADQHIPGSPFIVIVP